MATKMKALEADVVALRAHEPCMHIVVFTQHLETHRLVVEMMRRHSIVVYELRSGVPASRRHSQISEFQARQQMLDFL